MQLLLLTHIRANRYLGSPTGIGGVVPLFGGSFLRSGCVGLYSGEYPYWIRRWVGGVGGVLFSFLFLLKWCAVATGFCGNFMEMEINIWCRDHPAFSPPLSLVDFFFSFANFVGLGLRV